MNETVTELKNPFDILLDTTSQSALDSDGLENDEWFPINFQWRPIYKLRENLGK